MERYWLEMDTEIAPLRLVSDGRALVGLYFPQHRHAAQESAHGRAVTEAELGDQPALRQARQQLQEYFAGERREFDLALAPTGTAFQHRVWAALREIPYATTRSYGQVAEDIGSRGAARAVGMANGRNPLSIIVPCHRVIGSDGSLTGYGGGEANKRALLDLEARYTATAW
jgi:methylated-DNA-[protein]-cysteine S-methyltransferase